MLLPFIGFAQSSSVYITNEGNFGTGNGSLSIYDKITNTVTNDLFSSNNGGALLGDVVQSMEWINGNGYICVNNSSKIQVIDENHLYVTVLQVSQPRYIKQVNSSKAYATDWGINGVQVIDLLSNTITSTIDCGTGPEAIAVSNGFAYVCNVGGWGLDTTVTVINTNTDLVETTLTVGDKPNSAVVDINGNVWILTGGHTEYDANWNVISETAGVLAMINTLTNNIDFSLTFPVGNHPANLVINGAGNKMYFTDGSLSKAVYEFGINDTSLATIPIINRSFYGLGYDKNSNEIYASDAVDFVQQGWVYRYATSGSVVDSFQVGIIPGSFAFSQIFSEISELSTSSISVYPNPSKGRFFINSSEIINSIIIKNILGETVSLINLSSFSDVIDLTKQKKGLYLVEINTSSGTFINKLLLE